jgi:cystathionine beta-lyase
MDLSYILNHLGEEREEYHGAVSPPVYQTSNFAFANVAAMRHALPHEQEVSFYTRGLNPTTAILCQKLAALEGTDDALAFASGAAAISAAVISQLKAGDHVVCVQKPYGWAEKLFNQLLGRYGVTVTYVPAADTTGIEAAIQPNTRMLYLESPNSLTFELVDLEAVCAIAKPRGIVTIIDNSYSTPLGQQPAKWGVDIVVHSASKYLGGHSDVVAGVVCSSKAIIKQIFDHEFMNLGGIAAPFTSALLLRSLRTLPVRYERSTQSGMQVAEYLHNHPKVQQLIYPGHPSHPQYALAQKQMGQCGGLFSILLDAQDVGEIERFADKLQRFLLACSWGGHESLVLPVCALAASPDQLNPHLPWNLVRLYIGLEDPAVLIADLEQALADMR